MIRRTLTTVAAACSVLLLAGACGTPASSDASDEPVGDPVSGGSATMIQVREPVSLDPAALSNNWVGQSLLGNALYGTLMIDNPETLEIEYRMASDFSTTDGGNTFTLELQPGLTFTDGTPLDAQAVHLNWSRIADPDTGSSSFPQASQISATEVVDETTLRVVMANPNPMFAYSITNSTLNWIASPTALEKGKDAFNNAPIGAGPFVLTQWRRQDRMELTRNPDYWDAPRPYLDSITLLNVPDGSQRVNMLASGGADLASETSWTALARAEDAGLGTELAPVGGGQYFAMNTRRAPFDDPRARRAVSMALNLDDINVAAFEGTGDIPETLFPESSPFYKDIPLAEYNPEEAQRLFDELAAEGKPVEFTFLATTLPETKATAEVTQAQLAAYDNVHMNVEAVDFAAFIPRNIARDYEMMISSANVQEPDSTLWNAFHSRSMGNVTGISDPELDAALDAGRVGTTPEERDAAYEIVQKRLNEVAPGVWYTRAAPAVMTADNIHGIRMYSLGSPLPAEMWVTG